MKLAVEFNDELTLYADIEYDADDYAGMNKHGRKLAIQLKSVLGITFRKEPHILEWSEWTRYQGHTGRRYPRIAARY
jgi:hypothetical protein